MRKRHAVSLYRCSSPQKSESRTVDSTDERKMKKAVMIEDQDHQIALHVLIDRATGIDNPILYPLVRDRFYNVVYWVEPGVESRTRVTEGLNPSWEQRSTILIENINDHRFLNVEVQRFNSTNIDPGTSCGRVVVGRTRIPLPMEFNRRNSGSFTLLRTQGPDHRPEGQIIVAMRLEKLKVANRLIANADPVFLQSLEFSQLLLSM
ncbi:C2 domain [Sesbania bispinosa]|nr:C2 domain [Sesbania bispinosa]